MLFLGIGFILFAIVAYAEQGGSFLPAFFGFMGSIFVVASVLRLSRKEQIPKLDEKKLQP
jgi:hypothetical protein